MTWNEPFDAGKLQEREVLANIVNFSPLIQLATARITARSNQRMPDDAIIAITRWVPKRADPQWGSLILTRLTTLC